MESYHESKKGGDEMAIDKVTATLAGLTKDMQYVGNNSYEVEFTAPSNPGDYSLNITAYDEVGNVAIADSGTNADLVVRVSKWKPPKTNWTVNDRFNFEDYNRIKNNFEYLYEEAFQLWKPFEIEDMGNDIFDYVTAWKVKYFNAWEKNLDTINNIILTQDYGFAQTFFENGQFIRWNELNRIESAMLSMKDILDRQKLGLRKLSVRLGDFKGIKT